MTHPPQIEGSSLSNGSMSNPISRLARREWGLRASGAATRAALVGFLAVAFFACGAGRSASAQNRGVDCTTGPGPNMTIEIYNDDPSVTIFPVLSAGAKSSADTWMQACFRVAHDNLQQNPYPRSPSR